MRWRLSVRRHLPAHREGAACRAAGGAAAHSSSSAAGPSSSSSSSSSSLSPSSCDHVGDTGAGINLPSPPAGCTEAGTLASPRSISSALPPLAPRRSDSRLGVRPPASASAASAGGISGGGETVWPGWAGTRIGRTFPVMPPARPGPAGRPPRSRAAPSPMCEWFEHAHSACAHPARESWAEDEQKMRTCSCLSLIA